MRLLFLASTVVAMLAPAQPVAPPRVTETVFELADGGEMRYAISIPSDAAAAETARTPRPLVLALHPGGRSVYYGSDFMQQVVELALREWEAIIVAPDVPSRRWADQVSERAVLALLDHVMAHRAIDRDRILVTGFSMGGRGTWFFATRHADLFTGAIPMAASRGSDSLDGLGTMPIHIIHSPDDEVVPYGPAEETAELLAERGHPVRLIRVGGLGHYNMGGYIEPLRMAGEWMKEQWASK